MDDTENQSEAEDEIRHILTVFEILRSEGHVPGARAYAAATGMGRIVSMDVSTSVRVADNLAWLERAEAYERTHGRFSLLRRNDPRVRRNLISVNALLRAAGRPEDQYRLMSVFSWYLLRFRAWVSGRQTQVEL